MSLCISGPSLFIDSMIYQYRIAENIGNPVVWSQIAIANVLVDLNLVVLYGIAIICILYVCKKLCRILIWKLLKQTAKPPNLIPRQISVSDGTPFFAR